MNAHVEGRMPVSSFWCLVGSDQVTGKPAEVYFWCLSCRMETSALVMAKKPTNFISLKAICNAGVEVSLMELTNSGVHDKDLIEIRE